MPDERMRACDEIQKQRYPIHFSFKRSDLKVLDLICKKIVRMHEVAGPLYPDLTEKELDLVRAVWESTKKIR